MGKETSRLSTISGCMAEAVVHSIIGSDPQEDLETWLEFCRICRKAGNMALSFKTLLTLGWKGKAPVVESHGSLWVRSKPS